LRTLRGIDIVSAIGLVAEIGDIQRFAHPRHLMSYLGLVPSECSSGNTVRRGSITKTGNGHAGRLLSPKPSAAMPGGPRSDCALALLICSAAAFTSTRSVLLSHASSPALSGRSPARLR
jgi:transposase